MTSPSTTYYYRTRQNFHRYLTDILEEAIFFMSLEKDASSSSSSSSCVSSLKPKHIRIALLMRGYAKL